MIIFDNGTQMVGAERECCEMIKSWNRTKSKEHCTDREMKWQFTIPSDSYQNGYAESLVKSIKTALNKASGDKVLAPFELYACVLEAANPVNQ